MLTDVVDQLHEPSKKINIVDCLSRHFEKGTPAKAAVSYMRTVKKWAPSEPVIHIDDSDVVNQTDISLNRWVLFVMVLKVPVLKMFIKKAIV